MNKPSSSRGFMKGLIVFTVGICVIFIFLFQFAQNFSSSGNSTGGFLSLPGSNITAADYSNRYEATTNPLLDFGNSSYDSYWGGSGGRTVPNTDGIRTSPYAGKIFLSSGTASYANQTYEEYITLSNRSNESISITDWTVANGKGSRPIENRQNNYVYPVADSAVIGMGTEFLSPDGNFQVGQIVMRKGDTAYLMTGKSFAQFPFSIYTSFRENICLGYLDKYPFAPAVSPSCPSITADPQIRTVTDECYDYLKTIDRCENPEKTDKARFDAITTQCKNFIKPRLSYEGCVAYNRNSTDFLKSQWRVFLGKERELWASSRETITLYDAQGLIVDMITY